MAKKIAGYNYKTIPQKSSPNKPPASISSSTSSFFSGSCGAAYLALWAGA